MKSSRKQQNDEQLTAIEDRQARDWASTSGKLLLCHQLRPAIELEINDCSVQWRAATYHKFESRLESCAQSAFTVMLVSKALRELQKQIVD